MMEGGASAIEQVIPALVINLDRASARREVMREAAAAAGIALRFVSAVDSRSDSGRIAVDALPTFGPWGVFHGHDRACTLSHLKALREVVASDADHALILEDDVHLSSELRHWLASAQWWPEDADIVKLERWRDDKLLVALEKRALSFRGRAMRVLRSRHSGGAAYIVTRQAAKRILDAGPPNVPIDHLLFSPNVSRLARDLVIYQVTPALVVQGNEPPAEPGASPADRGVMPESKLRKDLLRGWQEIKVFPRLLMLLTLGRITFERIAWADKGVQG